MQTCRISKILIFRGGALGDFILTLPAIAALRQHWPVAFIELVGHLQYTDLAVKARLINNSRSLDSARMAIFFQSGTNLPQDEAKYIRSFDLIVSFLHDPDGVFLSHLKESGAKRIVAVSPLVKPPALRCGGRNPPKHREASRSGRRRVKSDHAAEYFLRAITDVAGDKFRQTFARNAFPHFIKYGNAFILPAKQFRHSLETKSNAYPDVLLKWPQVLKEKARRRLCAEIGEKQVIIIHPGSGSPAKNWPAEKFAALAKKIRAETGYVPLVIGGEADEKAIAGMRLLLPEFHFLVNAPLPDVASILSVAGGYAGNDSGITHLAAALGIPVVALVGPTDPKIWAPRGRNVAIIKSRFSSNESLVRIGVDDVFKMLIKNIGR